MPLYEYECPKCDYGRVTRFKSLANYAEVEHCQLCSNPLRKVISTPMVRGDITPYRCPVTGKAITSRKAHEENLQRTGSRVLEKGEREAAEKFRMESERKLERSLEETAARTVASWTPEKKELLARELATNNHSITRS